eukprot:Tbor_TRINITY_DN6098_c0_g2::TRINITY_DN6098_c0_g2_i1::g.10395::m.10395
MASAFSYYNDNVLDDISDDDNEVMTTQHVYNNTNNNNAIDSYSVTQAKGVGHQNSSYTDYDSECEYGTVDPHYRANSNQSVSNHSSHPPPIHTYTPRISPSSDRHQQPRQSPSSHRDYRFKNKQTCMSIENPFAAVGKTYDKAHSINANGGHAETVNNYSRNQQQKRSDIQSPRVSHPITRESVYDGQLITGHDKPVDTEYEDNLLSENRHINALNIELKLSLEKTRDDMTKIVEEKDTEVRKLKKQIEICQNETIFKIQEEVQKLNIKHANEKDELMANLKKARSSYDELFDEVKRLRKTSRDLTDKTGFLESKLASVQSQLQEAQRKLESRKNNSVESNYSHRDPNINTTESRTSFISPYKQKQNTGQIVPNSPEGAGRRSASKPQDNIHGCGMVGAQEKEIHKTITPRLGGNSEWGSYKRNCNSNTSIISSDDSHYRQHQLTNSPKPVIPRVSYRDTIQQYSSAVEGVSNNHKAVYSPKSASSNTNFRSDHASHHHSNDERLYTLNDLKGIAKILLESSVNGITGAPQPDDVNIHKGSPPPVVSYADESRASSYSDKDSTNTAPTTGARYAGPSSGVIETVNTYDDSPADYRSKGTTHGNRFEDGSARFDKYTPHHDTIIKQECHGYKPPVDITVPKTRRHTNDSHFGVGFEATLDINKPPAVKGNTSSNMENLMGGQYMSTAQERKRNIAPSAQLSYSQIKELDTQLLRACSKRDQVESEFNKMENMRIRTCADKAKKDGLYKLLQEINLDVSDIRKELRRNSVL